MIRYLFYIFGLVGLAATLNGVMDFYGFQLNDYGWQWHGLKILMQGCYVLMGFLIFVFSDRYADRVYLRFNYWTILIFWGLIFATLTGVLHEVVYHYILK